MMKLSSSIVLILCLGVVGSLGAKGSKGSSSSSSVAGAGYSQPIVPSYAVPQQVIAPNNPGRHDLYTYTGSGGQPVMMAQPSTQQEYYQPMDQATYAAGGVPSYGASAGSPVYARQQQQPYYEPVPQSSGHHHHQHYPIKRGHGWGHEGGIDKLAILIPLIIIPLLLCWPYFIYAAQHHHHPIVYAAPGWKRSGDGKAPTVKEAKDKKMEELTEKVLPKLKD